MGEWTAIVLAGQRPGETDFAESLGVSAKALIPVGGEPMLARVVRTLLASPSVGRIIVLAQSADGLLAQAPAWLAAEPRVSTAEAGDGISASIAAIAGVGLSFEEGLALEAKSGKATLATAWEGAGRFAGGEGRGGAGAGA